jgi:hypothetical protein
MSPTVDTVLLLVAWAFSICTDTSNEVFVIRTRLFIISNILLALSGTCQQWRDSDGRSSRHWKSVAGM